MLCLVNARPLTPYQASCSKPHAASCLAASSLLCLLPLPASLQFSCTCRASLACAQLVKRSTELYWVSSGARLSVIQHSSTRLSKGGKRARTTFQAGLSNSSAKSLTLTAGCEIGGTKCDGCSHYDKMSLTTNFVPPTRFDFQTDSLHGNSIFRCLTCLASFYSRLERTFYCTIRRHLNAWREGTKL